MACADDSSTVSSNLDGNDQEEFVFFWGKKSPFSQWHPANFTVNGIDYNCAEQYMMHQKAVLFEDDESAESILASDKPADQKRLGRKVKPFDPDVWDGKCRDIVKRGNLAKFSQNKRLKKELLRTKGKTLVEASPMDTIWGIGYGANHPNARDKALWRGKNWLGYALTEVKEELLKAGDQHIFDRFSLL